MEDRRLIKSWNRVSLLVCPLALVLAAACGGDGSPSAPTPAAAAHLTPPVGDTPSADEQLDTLRPTLTVKNGTSDQAGGARSYEFQVADSNSFSGAVTAITSAGYAVLVGKTGVPENGAGKTSFQPDTDLQPTTRYYWRARLVQGSTQSEWSPAMTFRTKLVGYNRPGELYDPLIHGETVGERFGSTDFVAGKGLRINSNTSYVRYLLPATISDGEFSMEVEGLRPDFPGDKTKLFGMQEGQDDYITNRYRVDIQYRGTAGFPPNAITFRVLYGDDPCCKYEPDTDTRFRSVVALDPSTPYFWKFTWGIGTEVRVMVREGGIAGSKTIYNVGVSTPKGVYAPNPQYAYLGAPTGRSGSESASVPGAIYRNVWIANHPRPASLGSALRALR
jgi:hypothetical protein